MNKQKQTITIFLVATFLILSTMSFISATYTTNGIVKEFPPENKLSNFFSIIQFSIWGTDFSVIGDARQCGDNNEANEDLTFGGTSSGSIDIECSDYGYDSCLIDLFYTDSGYSITGREGEYRDDLHMVWAGAVKYWRAQIYACPHPECSSDSDCIDWYGTGSTCKQQSCSTWGSGYKCTVNGITENAIPYEYSHIHYCLGGSDTTSAKCYYRSNNNQGACTLREYAGRSDCPVEYDSQPLFDSLSACQGSSLTCSQKSGVVCAPNYACSSGNIITGTASGNQCCNSQSNCAQVISTCSSMGGSICTTGKTCSIATVPSSNGDCCKGSCNSNNDIPNNTNTENINAITWNQFFSMSDEDFSSSVKHCSSNNQCNSLNGYNVSCKQDSIYLKRTYTISRAACDKTLGWLDEIGSLIGKIIPFGLRDVCGTIAKGYESFKDLFTGTKYCVAESNSTFGKIWESVLKTVAGLGVPAAWVMLATLGILILIIVLIISKL